MTLISGIILFGHHLVAFSSGVVWALQSQIRERDVYGAIADPTRRELIRLLSDADEISLHILTSYFPMGRTGVSKHLAVLKEAELVIDRRVGRETRYKLNPAPLNQVHNWLSHYEKLWQKKVTMLSRMLEEEAQMDKVISLDFQFPGSIDRVWSSLTNSATLAKWIYPNDFKAAVGHRFQFRAEPSQWWDGIINGEVLEVDEPRLLRYTWISGGENTTVTWTLNQSDDGVTHLHLEHAGFQQDQSFQGASFGWPRMCTELQSILTNAG